MQPIPMQISEKQIKSLISRSNFWYLDQILSILEKKKTLKAYIFPKVRTGKHLLR